MNTPSFLRLARSNQAGALRPARPSTLIPRRAARPSWRARLAAAAALVGLVGGPSVFAANILWVSDASPLGFSGPGTNFTDQGFVTLLQNAGHNVNRYNGPDSQNTNLTQVEIDALNTNDLIIVGRANASGQVQAPQGPQWNTNITKPLICMSPYLVRPQGNRFGWFTGDVGPDDIPTEWSAANPESAAADFLFGGVFMSGTNTAALYEEPMDRNTSHMLNAPVAGGIVYVKAIFANENIVGGGKTNTGYAIVGFPAGTAVRTGLDILAGYRMFIAGGTRESAAAPNGIPLYTGRENLTPTGEDIFLRAVQLAINNGVAPATDPNAPVDFTSQPTSVAVALNTPVSFSVTVTGAAPRLLQWQRDTGDAVTFTNIPDAVTVFPKSTLSLASTALADNGARFQVVASNAFNMVTSAVVSLIVTQDVTPPVVVSAASLDGTSIVVRFDELLDTTGGTSVDTANYTIDGGTTLGPSSVAIQPDGKSVYITVDGGLLGSTFTLNIANVGDQYGNMLPQEGVDLVCTNVGLAGAVVGALNPVGTNDVGSGYSFKVSGGGLNVAGTIDQLQFLYKTVNGNFDARVRVTSLVGTPDHLETTAKAMLMARVSTATNAGNVTVSVTPPAPGDDSISTTVRASTGGSTANLGSVAVPNGLPNAWLRLLRVGNQFTTFRSANGAEWTVLGSTTAALGADLLVGVGVVSHRNGKLVTGTFSDFQIVRLPSPPTIVNSASTPGIFSAALLTEANYTYTIQYKDAVTAPQWGILTNLTGDGTLRTFADPGPLPPTGSRFYRVVSP
ncbi:MAG: hypothetical protein HZA90_12895 [Verrucomicrobia bacterium]|nr:hypothetical protein [Verrucomicrobiota bacterium]